VSSENDVVSREKGGDTSFEGVEIGLKPGRLVELEKRAESLAFNPRDPSVFIVVLPNILDHLDGIVRTDGRANRRRVTDAFRREDRSGSHERENEDKEAP